MQAEDVILRLFVLQAQNKFYHVILTIITLPQDK